MSDSYAELVAAAKEVLRLADESRKAHYLLLLRAKYHTSNMFSVCRKTHPDETECPDCKTGHKLWDDLDAVLATEDK